MAFLGGGGGGITTGMDDVVSDVARFDPVSERWSLTMTKVKAKQKRHLVREGKRKPRESHGRKSRFPVGLSS